MLNNDHVQIVVGIVKIFNKNIAPYKVKKIEDRVIKIVNGYNRILNFFINNKLSLLIKDFFYSIFPNCPEFLFNDTREDYVHLYREGLTEDGELYSEFSVTTEVKYALDISKLSFFKKKKFIKLVNKVAEHEGVEGRYRIRKILTYEKVV